MCTKEHGNNGGGYEFLKIDGNRLQAHIYLLASIGNEFPVIGLRVVFSRGEV